MIEVENLVELISSLNDTNLNRKLSGLIWENSRGKTGNSCNFFLSFTGVRSHSSA